MTLEGFSLVDNEVFDNSNMKRDFLKFYHQEGANLDNSHRNIEFTLGENKNYHQIRNAYLQYEMTVEKDGINQEDRILIDSDTIRQVNIGFAYCFKKWCRRY